MILFSVVCDTNPKVHQRIHITVSQWRSPASSGGVPSGRPPHPVRVLRLSSLSGFRGEGCLRTSKEETKVEWVLLVGSAVTEVRPVSIVGGLSGGSWSPVGCVRKVPQAPYPLHLGKGPKQRCGPVAVPAREVSRDIFPRGLLSCSGSETSPETNHFGLLGSTVCFRDSSTPGFRLGVRMYLTSTVLPRSQDLPVEGPLG